MNLSTIPEINFNKAITKVNSIINLWKNRSLTPIGKLTVIKTLLLSQFNHLFTSIVTPIQILDKTNKIFFSFLWDGKPDKIHRSTIYMDPKLRGMGMTNIYIFEKSLELGWIKKIIIQPDEKSAPWYNLLKTTIVNPDNLVSL